MDTNSTNGPSQTTPAVGPVILAWERIGRWIPEQPRWQQDAFALLVQGEDVTSDDMVERLADLAVEEVDAPQSKGSAIKDAPTGYTGQLPGESAPSLVLHQISGVLGVNALAPTAPLTFGPKLTVIYGENGTGKSGYVRLLRQFGSARHVGPVKGNVFKIPLAQTAASIQYSLDCDSQSFEWTGTNNAPADLNAMHVFDSECAQVYLSKKNELVFDSGPLKVLRHLAKSCDQVKKVLTTRSSQVPSWRKEVPTEHKSSSIVAAFMKLPILPSDVKLTE
jgi:hypothetical protein